MIFHNSVGNQVACLGPVKPNARNNRRLGGSGSTL